LQRLSAGQDRATWPEPEAETIPVERRDHVQVKVEDVLASRLSIGQKQVDPLAVGPALVERCGYSLRDTRPPGARFLGGSAGLVACSSGTTQTWSALMGWKSINAVHPSPRHTTLARNPPATIPQKTRLSIPPLAMIRTNPDA
jgi:hypothetical protein